MDLKPSGLLRLFVLVSLLLEVQLRPVRHAPLPFSCKDAVESTKKISEVLDNQAKELLDLYTETFESHADETPEDVPDSNVTGENFSERLLDIYAKDELFSRHLSKVNRYLDDIIANLVPKEKIKKNLAQVQGSISNLLTRVKQIVSELYPDSSFPPEPEPLNFTHHGYAQKRYCWFVIDRVQSWGAQVAQVLEEGKEECKNWSVEIL